MNNYVENFCHILIQFFSNIKLIDLQVLGSNPTHTRVRYMFFSRQTCPSTTAEATSLQSTPINRRKLEKLNCPKYKSIFLNEGL